MNIIVYKGFNVEFLKSVKEKSLLDNQLNEKYDLNCLSDKKYKLKLDKAFLDNADSDETFWITYEELTINYDSFVDKIKDGFMTINIINNNIFPEYYPLNIDIDESVFSEYKKESNSFENGEKSLIAQVAFLQLLYADIIKTNEKYFASYYNFEFEHDGYLNPGQDFYKDNANIIKDNECDFLIKIGDDIEDYLNYITALDFNNTKRIAYSLFCETDISHMILKSLKAFLSFNKINTLYEFEGNYVSNDSLNNEFKYIAENVLKYENFSFKSLNFYKNPSIGNEMESISQGTIMSYIVEEAEKANEGKVYRDIFITAPTGAGKSLIFQIPSIYLANKYGKLIIIIEPLKGLMADQQEKYEKCGYKKARFLNSDIPTPMEREQIIEGVKSGEIDILYISPETLLSHSLESLVGEREIGLIVVDEAHIVTTWGVGFRPDYWYLGSYLNNIRKAYNYKGKSKSNRQFPIFACTATAVYGGKDDTVSDTVLSLYMNDPIIKIGTAKRKNISFEIQVYDKDSFDNYLVMKKEVLAKRIQKWIENKNKTIIYFPYKTIAHSVYKGTDNFSEFGKFYPFSGVYTGDYAENEIDKAEMLRKFRDNEIDIIYATKAFGMGVDIKDIQNVYHYAVTGNLSDYIQEIGRAARIEGIDGKAIIDYFANDLKYMNQLFGMSQIRQYHVKKCLSIIYDTYKNKRNRSFLINPMMFDGAFDNANNLEEVERKLKIVLLMLEKDLYEKFKNRILVSRPSSLFTRSYICIAESVEKAVLNGKYGKYVTKIADKRHIIQGSFKTDKLGDISISDIGNIFEINLKGIWENYYSSTMSFAAFKWSFYNKSNNVLSEIKDDYYPRVKLKISTKNVKKLSDVYNATKNEIDYLSEVLQEFGRTYFLKEEFKEKIRERYKNDSKAEIIANLYFNIIDPSKECIKSRTSSNEDVKYQVSDGRARSFGMNVIVKSSLLKVISKIESSEHCQFYREDEHDSRMLKLASLFDIINYEVEGGNTPEIYIRLNAPDKISRILSDKFVYVNSYVERARERHFRAVKILDYFFRNNRIDRWDFIEDYFLGKDIEQRIDEYDNSTKKHLKLYNIRDYIEMDGTNTYSLAEYNNWDEIIDGVIDEEKYNYYCNVLKNNGVTLPDYAYTDIVVKKDIIPTLFIYSDKNIIILPESNRNSTLKICKEMNWTVIPINDIENHIELLKGE